MAGTSTTFSSSLAEELAPKVRDRLVRYARVNTQSTRDRAQSPSTPGQLDLQRMLAAELEEIGLEDVHLDDDGYLFATLPGTGPTIGLLAHVDVSPDAPADDVEPIVHASYDGGTIELPRNGTVLDPNRMPELTAKRGHDIVTSSGDTLLGADDKAGVAEIMTAVEHLASHPEIPRPTIRVGFLPDEEIGEGASLFDVERFGARCAYTFDGSEVGELQDETFTAAEVVVEIEGVDIHPGFATGRMVNAARLAGDLLTQLPKDRAPETTESRQGFIHPYEVAGDASKAVVRCIVRDFEDDLLREHVETVRRIADELAQREPRARIQTSDRPQYPNMRDHLKPFPEVVEHAAEAIRREGLELIRTPIRGGTDGSQLSANGLPTPNVFTGGHEYHSVREWASVQDMASAAAVAVRLAQVWAENAG